MGGKQEYEIFYGSDLIEEGHATRINAHKLSEKSEFFKGHAKKLHEASLEQPVLRDREIVPMLSIAHPNMARRTKTVGFTVFIFNAQGVASVHPSALQDWKGLLRQPGFYDPVERAAREAKPVIPEPKSVVLKPAPEPPKPAVTKAVVIPEAVKEKVAKEVAEKVAAKTAAKPKKKAFLKKSSKSKKYSTKKE